MTKRELWNKCSECGKIMAYLRPATRIGHKSKRPKWHYDYSFHDPLAGREPDYVCETCWVCRKIAKELQDMQDKQLNKKV